MDTRLNIALIEDTPETVTRLVDTLRASADIGDIRVGATVQEALAWMQQGDAPPDVLLIDLGLPDGSGIDIIREAAQRWPTTDCMVVTMFGDEANMIRAFEAGAKGYLLKDDSQQTMTAHVMDLRRGGSPMSPIIARQLLMRMHGAPATAAPSLPTDKKTLHTALVNTMSKREMEVLQLIARGYTYPELAHYLHIGLTTVHTHVRNIYSKLSVHTKTEAVYEARMLGLLD
jgi:DNA-binding NarL/FixJ family response regulator